MSDGLCSVCSSEYDPGVAGNAPCPYCEIKQLRAEDAKHCKRILDPEEQVEILTVKYEDANELAERRKWGAEEMDALRAEVERLEEKLKDAIAWKNKAVNKIERLIELEQYLDDYVDLGIGFAKRGMFITDEQIDSAWELTESLRKNLQKLNQPEIERITCDVRKELMREFGIFKCEGCGGHGEKPSQLEFYKVFENRRKPCPDCNGHGWVIGKEKGDGPD